MFLLRRVARLFTQRLRPSSLFLAALSAARAPCISNMRIYLSPRLLIPPSLFLPPLEYCLGVKPSHADMSRPLLNCVPLPTAATSALAVIGPIPSTPSSRLIRSSSRTAWAILALKAAMLSSSARNSSPSPASKPRISLLNAVRDLISRNGCGVLPE